MEEEKLLEKIGSSNKEEFNINNKIVETMINL